MFLVLSLQIDTLPWRYLPNFIITSVAAISNIIIWYFYLKRRLVEDAKGEPWEKFFRRHTMFFWSAAWVVWSVFYAIKVFVPDLLEREPWLDIFLGDLNSILFLGTYFAYLRGRFYNKYDYYLLGGSLLIFLTTLQVSLRNLESYLASQVSGHEVSSFYFAPSLLMAIISYYSIGLAFRKRLKEKATWFQLSCIVYVALQIPLFFLYFNNADPGDDSLTLLFNTIAAFKIVIEVYFIRLFARGGSLSHLISLSSYEKFLPKKRRQLKLAKGKLHVLKQQMQRRVAASVVVGAIGFFAFAWLALRVSPIFNVVNIVASLLQLFMAYLFFRDYFRKKFQ